MDVRRMSVGYPADVDWILHTYALRGNDVTETEEWKPFSEDHSQTKAVGFHLDGRVATRLKLAGISMDFSTQLILECLVLSFLGEFDKRVDGPPSDEPLMVPFPWPPFGMDGSEYKTHVREVAQDAVADLAARGLPPHSLFNRYAEAHANATPTSNTRSSGASQSPEAVQEDARDAGRKWALGVKDIDKVQWVLGLEKEIGPVLFPSFLAGVREVADAFDKWDKQKRA
jgi:hypothetical protein